jgi:uncharacterized membrane protein
MRQPPAQLLFLIAAVGVLVVIVQLQLISVAFERLGLSGASASLLLAGFIVGSAINIPIARVPAPPGWDAPRPVDSVFDAIAPGGPPFAGVTIIAINVGGGILPIAVSIWLVLRGGVPLDGVVAGIAIVTAVSYLLSKPVEGVGIALPLFVPPLVAALVGVALGGQQAAPVAYVSGTIGVLLGADVLRLRQILGLRAPVAAIGGAGTFDGIFLTGIIAVLLA